jgi:hypothetical protein
MLRLHRFCAQRFVRVLTLTALAVSACDKKPERDNVPALPALPTWSTSAGHTQSGATVEVAHPVFWRAVVTSPTQRTVTYNAVAITPDSGALSLELPNQSGLLVFGQDSVDAGTTANAFIARKLKTLASKAYVADTARKLSDDVYQANLRTADGSPTGVLHVTVTHNTDHALMLWRMFLGDAEGNAMALQIAIDSLRVRKR